MDPCYDYRALDCQFSTYALQQLAGFGELRWLISWFVWSIHLLSHTQRYSENSNIFTHSPPAQQGQQRTLAGWTTAPDNLILCTTATGSVMPPASLMSIFSGRYTSINHHNFYHSQWSQIRAVYWQDLPWAYKPHGSSHAGHSDIQVNRLRAQHALDAFQDKDWAGRFFL